MRFNFPLPGSRNRFDQEIYYELTRWCNHCQELTNKYFIVVINKVGTWRSWGEDNSCHYVKIRNNSYMLWIY